MSSAAEKKPRKKFFMKAPWLRDWGIEKL